LNRKKRNIKEELTNETNTHTRVKKKNINQSRVRRRNPSAMELSEYKIMTIPLVLPRGKKDHKIGTEK